MFGIDALRMRTPGSTSIPAKRYWRLDFPSGSQTDTFVDINEFELRTTIGGARQDASGGGSASTFFSSGFGPAKAFDSDQTSYWTTTSGSAVGAWLANDCGSAKDVVEIMAGIAGAPNNAPDAFTVKYSDDGSTWTMDTRWPVLSPTTWIAYEYRIFQRTDQPGATTKRGVYFPLTTSVGGWTNYTIREQLLATRYPIGATKVKLYIRAGAGGGTISKCYIGKKGTGTLDFASTPTQLFFGGSASIVLGAGADAVSDEATFSHLSSEPLVVSIVTTTGAFQFTSSSGSAGYKLGDDSTTLTASGYTSYNGFLFRAEFTP